MPGRGWSAGDLCLSESAVLLLWHSCRPGLSFLESFFWIGVAVRFESCVSVLGEECFLELAVMLVVSF